MKNLFLFVPVLVAALWHQSAYANAIPIEMPAMSSASGILIGPFWLDGVRMTEYPDDVVVVNDGAWKRVDYEFGPTSSFTVFNAPIVLDGFPTSTRVFQKARADGIGIILSGRLRKLTITARILDSTAGREVWIEPDKLHAELGYVTSGLQQIAGGTMDLKGSRLWVKNLTPFRTRRAALEGTFELITWNRPLNNAHLVFAGGAEGTATLIPDSNDQNVTLHVDMSTGSATLWAASFSAPNISLKGATLAIGPATLMAPQMQVKRLKLAAVKGTLQATLNLVEGDARVINLRTKSIAFDAGDAHLSWDTSIARGDQTTKAATFDALDVTRAAFASPRARLSTDDRLMLKGALRASNVALSLDSLSGTFDWDQPEVPLMAFLIASGDVKHLTFSLDGKWKQPFMLSGAVDSKSFLIGGLKFGRQTRLAFPPSSASQDILIPITFSLGDENGRFEAFDSSNSLVLSAELQRLSLEALCVLNLSEFSNSRLDIEPHKLQFEVGAVVSISPWLGSTKPLFASATVKATNGTAVSVGAKTQSGLILVDSEALVLADPILKIGQAKPFRARTTLTASAGASFAYCLNRRDLVLTRADLHASADFKALEPGAAVDLGGTTITDPEGSITNLSVTVDRINNQAAVSSGAIQLGGSHVSRPRDSDRPNDLAFDGTLQRQLSIKSLDGTAEFRDDHIHLGNLRVHGMEMAANNVSLDLSQAISLTNASLSLKADEIVSSVELKETNSDTPKPSKPKYLQLSSLEDACSHTPEDGDADKTTRREYFTNVSLNAAGRLRIEGNVGDDATVELGNSPTITNANLTVSGRSDRLNGQGGAELSAFAGSIHSAITTDANCEGGHQLRIPMNILVATAGTTLTITLVNGKAEAKGSFGPFAMQMTSSGKAECEGAWHKVVLVESKSGWTEGICPTWKEPFRRCRWTWETPEVSYEYRTKAVVRALSATVFLTNPRVVFAERKILMCNVGPASVAPVLIVGGYYPEFRGNIPIISDVANVLVGTVAETTESGIATALGTGIGGLAHIVLGSALGPVTCIVLGIWR